MYLGMIMGPSLKYNILDAKSLLETDYLVSIWAQVFNWIAIQFVFTTYFRLFHFRYSLD